MKVALATIAIGARYEELFRKHCQPSLAAYCHRHGYSLFVFNRPLRELPGKSPSWQKLFLLDQPDLQKFDHIIYLDSDVIVRPESPPILSGIPKGLIGYIPEVPVFQSIPEWYASFKLPCHSSIVQGGVLCLEPEHRRILLQIAEFPETSLYEMPALSATILASGVGYPLDPRFNATLYSHLFAKLPHALVKNKLAKETLWAFAFPPMRRAYRSYIDRNWFLHAAGSKRDLPRIDHMIRHSR